MRRKKQVTLLIIPGDSGRSIRKKVSYSTIYTVITVATLLFATFAFMAINYSRIYYKALRAEILERRNLKLEEQWRKITRIEKDLALLKRTDKKSGTCWESRGLHPHWNWARPGLLPCLNNWRHLSVERSW